MEAEVEIQETFQEPMQQDPPRKKLWDSLRKKQLYTKSYEDFDKQFSTPESITKLHKVLTEKQLYTKSTDDFKNQFFQDTPTLKKKEKTTSQDLQGGGEIGGTLGSSNAQSKSKIDPLKNQKQIFSGLNKAPTDDFTKLESTATVSKKPVEKTGGVIGIEEIMAQQRSDLGKPLATDNNAVQLPPTQMEINDRLLRQKQYKKNVEIAIDNTTKEYFRLKGIKAREGSSIYQEQKQKIQEKFEDGDVAYHMDLKTNTPRLDRITGWWENLAKGWNEANASNDEAAAFVHDMNTEDRLKYIQEKQLDESKKVPSEYLEEGQGGLGWLGHTVGGAAPFLGKAAAGVAIGAGALAAAPASAGASLAGLPVAMSFLFTAPDMANIGGMEETIRRYNIIKKENPLISDMDAMSQAESGILAGGIGGIAENALFMGTMKLPLSNEGKKVIGKFATETLQSGLNMGGATAIMDVAQKLEGVAEGYKTTPKEVAESAVNTFVDNATIGMALHGMIAGAKYLPKAVNSAFKFALKDVPPKEISETLQMNVEAGTITPEQAQKTLTDIQGYKEALDKINTRGLSETSQASIAGLIQAKENLKKEAETKDESVRKLYDEKIEAINQQIADIQRTNKPFEHEVDDVTGNNFAKPTFDDVAKQRVNDVADKISKGKTIEDVVDVQTQAKFPEQLTKQLEKILKEEKSANKDKENPNNEISDNITKYLEENKKEEVVDTKLSEPVEGLNEQGIPKGENVPPPTEPTPSKEVVPDVVVDKGVDNPELIKTVTENEIGNSLRKHNPKILHDIVDLAYEGKIAEEIADALNDKYKLGVTREDIKKLRDYLGIPKSNISVGTGFIGGGAARGDKTSAEQKAEFQQWKDKVDKIKNEGKLGVAVKQELSAEKINKQSGVDVYVARQEVEVGGDKYFLSQIKENGNTNTFLIEDANGNEVGKAQLSADGNYLENIRIDEKHRRKGLASKVYDFIELRKGIELEPSPNKQSKEAKALWDKRSLQKSVSNKANGGLLAKALNDAIRQTFGEQSLSKEQPSKGADVESATKLLEGKLPEFQNNTRTQATKDLIKWAEDIFDTKFEGDFDKGEYVSFFNSLGDKGYEAARFLQNPKKALSILKESPTYLAKTKTEQSFNKQEVGTVDEIPKVEKVENGEEKEGITYSNNKYESGEDIFGARIVYKDKAVTILQGLHSEQEVKAIAEKVYQQLKDGTYKNGWSLADIMGRKNMAWVERKTEENKPEKNKQEVVEPTPEIKKLEAERDAEIEKVSKPDFKLELVKTEDLVNSKDPIGNRERHNEFKERYKKLRRLIDCL